MLSVFVPDAAVPEGTRISLTPVENVALPKGLSQLVGSGTGYRLEPDGLILSKPATATLTVDRSELTDPQDTQSAYALVSFSDTAGREVLDSDTVAALDRRTVTVTAQIQHFSWITRTKGSLDVGLQRVQHQQSVGSRFKTTIMLGDHNPQITLSSVTGTALIAGVLGFVPGTATSVGLPEYRPGYANKREDYFYPEYACPKAGTGEYGVHVTAVSTVTGNPNLSTNLSVTLEGSVDCVEGSPEPESHESPDVSPPGKVVHLVQTIGCEHTQPGVQSELQKKGHITDRNGSPVAGAAIVETATGPALVNDVGQSVTEFAVSAVTDANGEFTLIWPIRKFGAYSVTVTDLHLPGGIPAAIDDASVTTLKYAVGQTCTPP